MTRTDSAVFMRGVVVLGAAATLSCGCKSDSEDGKKARPAPAEEHNGGARPAPALAPTTAAIGIAKDATVGDLPRATELLDRHVEVTGGRTAREKVTSIRTVSMVTVSSRRGKGRTVTYAATPRKAYMRGKLPEGMRANGTDGKTVWEKTPRGRIRLFGGVEKAEVLLQKTLHRDLRWRELFTRVETVGVEEVGGEPAFHVRLNTPHKTVWHQYFDEASGFLVRVDNTIPTPHGTKRTEVYYSDYRDVEEIKVPFKVVTVVRGLEHTSVAERVDLNVEIPEGTFDLPADVQKLVDKREATRRLKRVTR